MVVLRNTETALPNLKVFGAFGRQLLSEPRSKANIKLVAIYFCFFLVKTWEANGLNRIYFWFLHSKIFRMASDDSPIHLKHSTWIMQSKSTVHLGNLLNLWKCLIPNGCFPKTFFQVKVEESEKTFVLPLYGIWKNSTLNELHR